MNYNIIDNNGETIAINAINPENPHTFSNEPEELLFQNFNRSNFGGLDELAMKYYNESVLKDNTPSKPLFEHEMNTYNPVRGRSKINQLYGGTGSIRGGEQPIFGDEFNYHHLDTDPRGASTQFDWSKHNYIVDKRIRNTGKFFNDENIINHNAPHSKQTQARINQGVFKKTKMNYKNFHQERQNILTGYLLKPVKVLDSIGDLFTRSVELIESMKNKLMFMPNKVEVVTNIDFSDSIVVRGRRYRVKDLNTLHHVLETDQQFANSQTGLLVKQLIHEYKKYQQISDGRKVHELSPSQLSSLGKLTRRIREIMADIKFNDKQLYNSLSKLKVSMNLKGSKSQELEMPMAVMVEIVNTISTSMVSKGNSNKLFTQIIDDIAKGENLETVMKKHPRIFTPESRNRIKAIMDQSFDDTKLKTMRVRRKKPIQKIKQNNITHDISSQQEYMNPYKLTSRFGNTSGRTLSKITDNEYNFENRTYEQYNILAPYQ